MRVSLISTQSAPKEAHWSEKFFEEVYRDLYAANKELLSSDSRRNGTEEWIKQLRIIDSTNVPLFSNTIFKGVGRHPKTGKKKGGVKVHSVIHANEGVPCEVQISLTPTFHEVGLTNLWFSGE